MATAARVEQMKGRKQRLDESLGTSTNLFTYPYITCAQDYKDALKERGTAA